MEDQMRAIQAVANATAEEMLVMSEKALQLGRDTTFTADEVAEGLASLRRAGLAAEEAMHVMAVLVGASLATPMTVEEFNASSGEEPPMPEVIIEHPKTGESYGIQSGDFRRGKHYRDPKTGEMETYESAGFRIVSMGDGSEYHPPAERHSAVLVHEERAEP